MHTAYLPSSHTHTHRTTSTPIHTHLCSRYSTSMNVRRERVSQVRSFVCSSQSLKLIFFRFLLFSLNYCVYPFHPWAKSARTAPRGSTCIACMCARCLFSSSSSIHLWRLPVYFIIALLRVHTRQFDVGFCILMRVAPNRDFSKFFMFHEWEAFGTFGFSTAFSILTLINIQSSSSSSNSTSNAGRSSKVANKKWLFRWFCTRLRLYQRSASVAIASQCSWLLICAMLRLSALHTKQLIIMPFFSLFFFIILFRN